MNKVEKFIQENTKNCSNALLYDGKEIVGYEPWLTPDDARKAGEIVKEKIYEWIEDNIGEYCYGDHLGFSAISIENIDLFDQESFIDDLRKVMKDE